MFLFNDFRFILELAFDKRLYFYFCSWMKNGECSIKEDISQQRFKSLQGSQSDIWQFYSTRRKWRMLSASMLTQLTEREYYTLINAQEHILSLKRVIQPTTPVPPWVFNKSLGLSLLSVLVNIWYQIGWSYAFQLSAHKQAVYHRTHLLRENSQPSKISLILVNIFKKTN